MATLSEAQSKDLLRSHGVPVVPEELVFDAAAAGAAAERIGYPVVAKLCAPGLAHKTERGLVKLGLRDRAAVEDAAATLLAAAEPGDGPVGAGGVGILVGPMVSGIRELIAGVVRDPQFGPCVMLGLGGVLAEAVADVAFRVAPLERVDASELIDDLSVQKLLGPFRGEPAIDREKLIDVVTGLAGVVAAEPDVVSIDVNPLIISEGIPIAVDALVEVSG